MSGEVTEAAPLPAPTVTAKDSSGEDPNLDTFDNPLPVNTETPQAKHEQKPDTDSLETQTDDSNKPKEEQKKEDVPKETQENKTPVIPKKTIKAVDGEDAYELSTDMQLRLKNGDKYDMVSLADIKENYGTAMEVISKATEIQQKEVQFREEYNTYKQERAEITEHFSKIGKLLDDPDTNPLEALNYLLDLTGRNRYEFNKKVLEKQLDELDMLQGMDEVERAKYFLEKENAYLKEKQEISRSSMKEKLETEKFVDQVTRQREASGVSEDEFVGAYNDLISLGNNESSISPEQVIAYAISLPAVLRSEELLKKVDPSLIEDDEIVLQLAEYLKENPQAANDEIIRSIEAELGMKREVKQLNKKVVYQDRSEYGSSSNKTKDSDDFETFDDLNIYGRS